MANKLIIIGNGFDLHAGLKSTFSDFFEKSERHRVEKWLSDQKKENLSNLSFISFLLYNTYYRSDFSNSGFTGSRLTRNSQNYYSRYIKIDKIVNWMDVEGFICSVFQSKIIDKLISCYNECYKKQFSNINSCICDNDYVPRFIFQCIIDRNYSTISSFYEFFFEELRIFENSFSNYLSEQMAFYIHDYDNNSTRIFSKLIKPGDTGIILNFNYTHIKNKYSFREINIHGSIEKDIIIGINDRDNLKSDEIQFTKTFRKLIDPDESVVLNRKYVEIIIYGHSLGEQDYSYFQSILDFSSIYNSSTIIRFIYSDDYIKEDSTNPGYSKKLHRIKMARKLFALMKSYGSTLNNKDNGQNLVHKMLLEGRLKLELNNFEDEL